MHIFPGISQYKMSPVVCVFVHPHTYCMNVCLYKAWMCVFLCVPSLELLLRAWWDRSSNIYWCCILWKVTGEVEVHERAGLLFPLGETSLCTACLFLFYKSTKTVAPLRLRWHTSGNVSVLCSVFGTGLQGDGSEQIRTLWGLFSFWVHPLLPLCGFHCLSIVL